MNIEVYGTPACSKCKDVINFLQNKDIVHTYSTIGEDIEVDDVINVVGRVFRSVPIIMVDGGELTFNVLKEKIDSINILEGLEL